MRLTDKDTSDLPLDPIGYDTGNMDFLATNGDWDVFGFGPTHGCHSCLAPIGGLFLVYEHRPTGTVLTTPCVQNDACFELSKPDGDVLIFGHLDELLALGEAMTGVQLPSKTSIWANQRWFVDHPEARSRGFLMGPQGETCQSPTNPEAIH